jgi:hypothetical protein
LENCLVINLCSSGRELLDINSFLGKFLFIVTSKFVLSITLVQEPEIHFMVSHCKRTNFMNSSVPITISVLKWILILGINSQTLSSSYPRSFKNRVKKTNLHSYFESQNDKANLNSSGLV